MTVTVPQLQQVLGDRYRLEAAPKPFFHLLGTPDQHKRHVIDEGGHFVPRPVLIRESLQWYDKYLGPVKGR